MTLYKVGIENIDADKGTLTLSYDKSVSDLANLIISNDGYIELHSKNQITVQQRKAIFGIVSDVANHTGYKKDEMERILKMEYLADSGEDHFSLSNVPKDKATDFIHYLVDFCTKNDFPIRLTTYDKIPKDDYLLHKLFISRKCLVCGKPADIHHIDTVGVGNNRNHIHNSGRHFMALCREHHTQFHKIGINKFNELYHFGNGIIPTDKELREVGLNV